MRVLGSVEKAAEGVDEVEADVEASSPDTEEGAAASDEVLCMRSHGRAFRPWTDNFEFQVSRVAGPSSHSVKLT